MSYQLRRVTEQDKAWLYALKTDAYLDVVEPQFGNWNEELQRQMFAASWNPSALRIVCVSDLDVGLLDTEDRGDAVWLNDIQLMRSARDRGLGSQIIRDISLEARAVGKPLRLQVLQKNERAKGLYERLGFKQIGATDTHYAMQIT